ncbi:MAG: hypothetical protein GXP38_01395 [Chloroflexi bacterium]|nr:hypothetical protein [Chloroflexota bacterium]
MDYIAVIKKAAQTTLRYRALWILGFLWALAGGGGSGGASARGGTNFSSGSENWHFEKGNLPHIFSNPAAVFGWIVLLLCIFLILALVLAVLRYVLQAGIYRSLHQLDQENEPPRVREALRQGWHVRTWRLFLQNLVIGIPTVLVLLLLLALAASPLLMLLIQSNAAKALGIVGAVSMLFVWIIVVVIVTTAISILKQFWWRAAVIGDQDTFTAIRSAWHLVRTNLRDVFIMWLLMLGVGILFGLLMIPIVLLLIAFAGVIAGIPAYLLYQATSSIIPALIWAVPTALFILILPMAFVNGLYLVFQASVWNQVYDQLVARTGLWQPQTQQEQSL